LPDGTENPLFVKKRNRFPGLDMNAGDPLPDGRDGGPSITTSRFAMQDTVFTYPPSAGVPGGFGGPQTGWHHLDEDGIRTAGSLEATPHGDVHSTVGGVGGLMSSFSTAARDPIFWLHHSNIDRLWAVWLTQADRANPTDPSWLKMTFHFHDADGQDVTHEPRDVSDLDELGYTYSDLSLPAGPMEAPGMPAESPPDHPAELVGATGTPVVLAGTQETVRFGISQPAGPLAATGDGTPSRVYLNVEDIRAEQNPGLSYAVYANAPDDDDDPTNDAYYVGNISFFGIERAQEPDDEDGGLRHVFDITGLVTRLRDSGRWNAEELTVTFAPVGPPPAARPAGAPDTPPVTVGRVSLFYQ
jgi:tyrosinase